jgi:hypothetical protein
MIQAIQQRRKGTMFLKRGLRSIAQKGSERPKGLDEVFTFPACLHLLKEGPED